MRRFSSVLLLAVVLSTSSLALAQVNISFEKTSVADGVWIGTVAGDVTGRLVTVMISADQSQPVWEVDFYWIIVADDPAQSFVARLTGTLDSETGTVAMTGQVDEGFSAGARVVEAGQLQDAGSSTFTGTIELTDAAADASSGYPWDDASLYPAVAGAAQAGTLPATDAPRSDCVDVVAAGYGGYPWDDASYCSPGAAP